MLIFNILGLFHNFLQQVSGKSNSNYNTENVEGKLYLTG